MRFFSKLSQRERTFFYITAVIITLFLVDSFIFNGMITRINELDNKIMALKNELSENKIILSYKDKINKGSKTFGKYLVKEVRPDLELSKSVNTLTIQSGLVNPEFKPIQSKDTSKYLIEINAEGKMKDVVNFLYNLNMIQSLLKVERIDLSPKAAKSETLRINVLISKAVVQ